MPYNRQFRRNFIYTAEQMRFTRIKPGKSAFFHDFVCLLKLLAVWVLGLQRKTFSKNKVFFKYVLTNDIIWYIIILKLRKTFYSGGHFNEKNAFMCVSGYLIGAACSLQQPKGRKAMQH